MKLPNNPKVLAATYNKVSNTKMFSVLVDFPTVLLAELRTHKILTQGSLYEHSELTDLNLSANSARAIPSKDYLQKVLDNPYIPMWTSKKKGMNGGKVTEKQDEQAKTIWLNSLKGSTLNSTDENSFPEGIVIYNQIIEQLGVSDSFSKLCELDIHKQNANRLLAPYAYTTCILSGTEWDNFFELRCPKYKCIDGNVYNSKKEWWYRAKLYKGWGSENIQEPDWQDINISPTQPEFQIIAEMIYDLYQEADWKESKYHIPFEDFIYEEYGAKLNQVLSINEAMKISASMCAKLSYNTQDNPDTLEKHLERADMLIRERHSEPFSHQAIAMTEQEYDKFYKSMIVVINGKKEVKHELGWCYNLRGFISQRFIIENW
jgi:hypothetical protein